MDFSRKPSISDVQEAAVRRIPQFARAFLESGTGSNQCVSRNIQAFSNRHLTPQYLRPRSVPDLRTRVLKQEFSAPFGIAPIGLASLIWPNAERRMAEAAKSHHIPFCLSTIASLSIEDTSAILGRDWWFQLYPLSDLDVQADLLTRCRNVGLSTLVVTVDVPVHNRRESMKRAGIGMPLKFTPKLAIDCLRTPAWLWATVRAGQPAPKNLLRYIKKNPSSRDAVFEFLSQQFGHPTNVADLRIIRNQWAGQMVVKGILSADDARQACENGADAIVVSNHGGRQLDAALHPLDVLADIRKAVGPEIPVLLDSGIRSGQDIAIALSHGADFVLVGRSFLYGSAAHPMGATHVGQILRDSLHNVMCQLGCNTLSDLSRRR